MRDWLLGDWFFGSARRSYLRARENEAHAIAEAEALEEGELRRTVDALRGDESFVLGSLSNGTTVTIAPREIGRHGMVWGSSGAGKSYGVHVITEGWTRRDRRLQLIDPKGETFLLKAIHIAARYGSLPESQREAFASRFRVFDVSETSVTPVDLFHVPEGMSPALLANLRTAATTDLSSHVFSDLMAYGIFLLYSAAINLGWGVTIRIVRAFFLDGEFRERVARLITDERLRDSISHLETTLPEQSRKAIVRQFDILLASAPARVSFGLPPSATRELLPDSSGASVLLGNFGPTPQRPPALAKTMATNRLIDVLSETSVRREALPEMLLLEEVGVLVKQPAVAEYLLEASRTLRWKGLGIVCVAQDPANAIPPETCTALVLNSKWLLSFECGRDEAMWLLPHTQREPGRSDAEERRAFFAEMAKLPTQHAVFVRKGLPGLRLTMRTVDDPTRARSRDELLETFTSKIAARSMIRMEAAERRIEEFEESVFSPDRTPRPAKHPSAKRPQASGSVEDFFSFLDEARKRKDDE